MPIYDFHCRACSHEFEALVRPQDQDATKCPACQGTNLERLLSSFAVSTAEKTQAAAKKSRASKVNANKEKLAADEEERNKNEGP